jgi:cell division protein FtsB
VAELADALRSGRSGQSLMWVQVPPSAPELCTSRVFLLAFILYRCLPAMIKYIKNIRIDKNKAIYIGGLVIVVFIMMTLFGRISELARLTSQRNSISTEIANLEKTHTYLESQLAYATSVKAVEDYAREEGHMALPGDKIIVPLPPVGETPQPKIVALPTLEKHPAWQIWWSLFFGE